MWKRPEDEENEPQQSTPAPFNAEKTPRPEPTRRGVATIGPSISITGELSGEEDLIIDGRIEGKVNLEKQNVTVGKAGRVKADIVAKNIQVEGQVEGNLLGEEGVVIHQSGKVKGNIVAPRVSLENGSKFKGAIDMEPRTSSGPRAAPGPKTPESEAKSPQKGTPSASPDAQAKGSIPPSDAAASGRK
ncbi:MAG TPA: polymer-forming cytoskeletal protein [Thermoanaerobaculia bacterium]|nr:polymer-forming cytoskeletal protein [Thermoanaerobaculia bacterium]